MLSHMSAHTRPLAGDGVVREDQSEGATLYVLRTVPSPGQLLLRTREEAVAQAIRFAANQVVCAWFAGENGDSLMLNDVRMARRVRV